MNTTTKPGVLAVMDPAAELGVKQSEKNPNAGFVDMRDWFAHVGRMKEARATVERLLAADTQYDAAKAHRIEADNRIASGDRSDDAFRRQASASHAYDRAVERRRAALAAFHGEQP